MSGIGGIIHFDGSSIDRESLQKIADAIRKRGPDGIKIWNGGNVGVIHAHFWTTPEDVGEEQPISDGPLTIAADARIDNRQELISLLGDVIHHGIHSDAQIILAAYQKWGEECPKHLIGDFAFVLWDAERQCLFCARDPVGIRLLHYSNEGDSFIFGSSVGSVLAARKTVPLPNINLIADLLAGKYERWVNETAFEDIFRLPPAYSMTVHASGIRLMRYWAFGAQHGGTFSTEEDYIARFGELFQEAVRCRMRAIGSLALTVSGGLDSSSIACVANHLVSSGEATATGRMYSAVYEHTPSADEKEYLDELIVACPHFSVTEIPSDDLWGLLEFADDNNYPLDDPETEIIRAMILTQLRRASQNGHRVVISGHGGDQVMDADAYRVPFYLKDVSLAHLPREMCHFLRNGNPILKLFTDAYIVPYIPSLLRSRLSRAVHDPTIAGLFTSRCVDVPSPVNLYPSPGFGSISSDQLYLSVTEGLNSVFRVTQDIYAAEAGIDWRFPFYDRRIIEFMLSVPPKYIFRDGYSRCLLRKSLKGILPEKIRMRRTKGHGGEIVERGIKEREKHRVLSFINDSLSVRMGLVHNDALVKAWDSYWNTGKYPARPLVRFLCAEAWLRNYDMKYGLPGEMGDGF